MTGNVLIPRAAMSATELVRRLLKVSIIGLPNAGKSTLINSLMSTVVCPVSKRVHTTRKNQVTAYLQDDTQVVFVDTPGLVNVKEIKKFSFAKDFVFGPEKSVSSADLVAVIHDVSNATCRNKLDPRVKGVLQKFPNKNCVLILNKIDTLKSKHSLLDTVRILTSGIVGGKPMGWRNAHVAKVDPRRLEIESVLKRAKRRLEPYDTAYLSEQEDGRSVEAISRAFTEEEIQQGLHLAGWHKFQDVFMISALNMDGISLLQDYFVLNAKPCAWMFEDTFLTDVEPQDFTIRVIRALLLDHLPQEMPYKLNPIVEFWEQRPSGELKVIVQLECPNSRYVGRVLGSGGGVMRKLCQTTEGILGNILKIPVNLVINPYSVEKAKPK